MHKESGKEAEALAAFDRAMTGESKGEIHPWNVLWGKACISRMLRRVGRNQEAEKHEKFLRCVEA